MSKRTTTGARLKVAGLFAGIGGIELGLSESGHDAELLCELDPGASRVLATRFPGIPLSEDVRTLKSIGKVDLVTAGFPCQDLSQAGRTAGIRGASSGLVAQLFRLLDLHKKSGPTWLLLENVSFMLQLDRGRAMRYLVDQLEERGFAWAYRVVDTRAFGLPQRRQRVIMIASRTEDPRQVLFADEAGPREQEFDGKMLCGFYWTEGLRGLGWAVNGVPTLKGGSTIGIPSPPAIWNPLDHSIVTPEIRDAERLQGFPANWTLPAVHDRVRRTHRWKLVGNAVSVPVGAWIGHRLAKPGKYLKDAELPRLDEDLRWPKAAWGHKGVVHPVSLSMWPLRTKSKDLDRFLSFPVAPLSARASIGFHSRASVSGLRFELGFLEDLRRHIVVMSRRAVA